MSSWMTVPCWSQRVETETNEERQEVKKRERERQKQIHMKIPVRHAGVPVRVGEVTWRGLRTHTHRVKVQAYVLCFISSFFCYFLSARCLLSQRLRREMAVGGRGKVPLCLCRAPIPVQLTQSCVRRIHPADVRQAVN